MWKKNLENRKYKAAEKLKENNVTLNGGKHKLIAVREIHSMSQTFTVFWTGNHL